eukprot:CAMPEP_0171097088 /NCGR_PEP_ID=MMETSP0766_2-20121228/46946_1 /TAXON_ID=439317 /ORGANISM="Gambierdiscus australes, Strain CAWD 149" /LENGTH=39 /DNA_ID= /DNA_START= /DNA_END= /DNA_ORIENTATION=
MVTGGEAVGPHFSDQGPSDYTLKAEVHMRHFPDTVARIG